MRVAVDNPHYLFQVDALWAQEQGYLKEYGIDSYKGSVTDNPIQAMIGGSVDMVLFDTDTLIAAADKTGEDIKIVGMYINQEANILGVRKGINTGEDLKKVNAKIAVSGRGTRSYVQMEQMLKENNVDPDSDVSLVDTGGQSNERLQQTLNGTVDGGSVQLRHETLLEEGGGKFLFKKVFDAPQLAWGTTGEFIKKDPEGVAAFLAATLKARQEIVDQKQQGRRPRADGGDRRLRAPAVLQGRLRRGERARLPRDRRRLPDRRHGQARPGAEGHRRHPQGRRLEGVRGLRAALAGAEEPGDPAEPRA